MYLRLRRRCAIVAVAVTAALCSTSAALAEPAPAPTAGSSALGFGPILDWSAQNPENYARQLGGTPQFYGKSLGYPLRTADINDLDAAVQAAASQGSSLLVQLEPRVALAAMTTADADALAEHVATVSDRLDTPVLIDFAPEMNGSWTPWGQQPKAFVGAYRVVAAAVHRRAHQASMVWEPANGAGYPFGGARGEVRPTGPRVVSQLDTNRDRRVTEKDDPYGVYWPGAAAVDRVGLSVYWYGRTGALGINAMPPANWYRDSLTGTVGYSTPTRPGRNFVARFAVAQNKPMIVETGALTVPSSSVKPAPEAIADAWLDQVFAATTHAAFPAIDDVAWFEQKRAEAESHGVVVDWRVTAKPRTTATLRADLRSSGTALGPVPTTGGRTQANAATGQIYESAGSQADRILGSIVVLLVLFLGGGLAARFRPRWRYPVGDDPDRGALGSRDGRIDLLRGFVMAAVVVTHIGLAGPWSWFVERAGALTGAEMFVLLSGVVLGALYPRIATKIGEYAAGVQMVRRAVRLYAVTVAVILTVFFVAKIPGLDANGVTTFTDRGTGSGGEGAAGRVYYLFGTSQHLLDYPPPGYAIKDLLLLRYGPWPINIMGLFVLLSLAVPACMWLVRRGLWWALLIVSWGLYVLNAVHPVQIFDAQFEAVFPLLAWQLAFTHGLVIGRYRRRIAAALTSTVGKIAVTVGLLAYLGGLLALRAGVHLAGVPAYRNLYDSWYPRTNLDGGRLLDLAISAITIYAFLTTCWRPVHATIGRFFEPLGRASLTVFFLQVFLVLAIGNIPHLDEHSAWQGFTVQTVALALCWALVRPWRRARGGADPGTVPVPVPPRQLVAPG